jgi:capsular polysaccharide biosynthesis protein
MEAHEIIALFRQAKVVVGASGANLAPVLFCEPGTKVVELTYFPYSEKYYFQGGSAMGGLLHSKIEGDPVRTDDPDHLWNFHVDPSLLEEWLEAFL